jgi:anaerobic magnesium-protoporphyrin IX monomethyl ester cyclase
MDVLFVNTPLFDYSSTPFQPYISLAPLGLAYLATWLDHQGIAAEIFDGESHGLSPDAIAAFINDKSPRYLGINLLTPTYSIAAQIIERVKPEITILTGGAHLNALPADVLNDPRMAKVKYGILGDGEFKLEALVTGSYPAESIPGLVYRQDGKVMVNPDQPLNPIWTPLNLDALPFVDRRFLDTDPFFSEGRLEANIIASRGCPFSCSFCSGAYAMVGKKPRIRSVGNIIEEVTSLNKTLEVTAIRFVDDLLLWNIPTIRQLTSALIDSGLSDQIVWQANGHVSVLWDAPDDVLNSLVQSGCRQLSLGIESGSQRMLDRANKNITVQQARILIKRLSEYGIRGSGYFIVGFPGETMQEIQATLALFQELRELSYRHIGGKNLAIFRGNIFEFRPYPQTIEWQRLESAGYRPEEMLDNYYPLIMDGLDERMKRRWCSGLQFSAVPPADLHSLIGQALQKQNDDLTRYGGLPDFAWNSVLAPEHH